MRFVPSYQRPHIPGQMQQSVDAVSLEEKIQEAQKSRYRRPADASP
ncbi:hypothetical protein E2C01_095741 [Portunus trituberculatus]|uniref:Uncharacterized protein n=1 Tax=Portunus trituberculatus TaxID=210409 RepID=A0A5B7JZL8_PORTR|nr:hypothetical protein [Portunus trituberculatus]